MPKVTYIEYDGTAHQAEVPVGLSVMRGAVGNNVPGIDGECACATCHAYVDLACLAKVGTPEPGSMEASMLSFAAVTQPNSRLSCQIEMRDEVAPQNLHILWEEILKRYPVIEVVGEAQRTYSNFSHGFRSLPVRIPAH
jgi:2Fe-2S ferredoxin